MYNWVTMKMNHKSISLVGIAAVVLMFQNCSGVSFQHADPSLFNKLEGSGVSLVPIEEPTGGALGDSLGDSGVVSDGMHSTQIEPDPGAQDSATTSLDSDGSQNEAPGSMPTETGSASSSSASTAAASEGESSAGQASYVCLLDGNGKSVRVGLVNAALGATTSTPQTVCMTQHACLEILSQSFAVVTAERRGYCNGRNPHVVNLSDDQIKDLVGGM